MRTTRMKSRADFLNAQQGIRRRSTGLVLEICPTPQKKRPETGEAPWRAGFTASKKVGNSVARNRARRRLRALAAEILAQQGLSGTDYVLVAKPVTLERPFALLRQDMVEAIQQAHRKMLQNKEKTP